MNLHTVPTARRGAALAILGLALSMPALAQQTPLTGRMMDGRDAVAPAAPTAPSPVVPVTGTADTALAPSSGSYASYASGDPDAIGYTTRRLLRMQASGSEAGRPLPMLGDEATAAYRRYIQSFSHPIPEFFKSTVGKGGNGGR